MSLDRDIPLKLGAVESSNPSLEHRMRSLGVMAQPRAYLIIANPQKLLQVVKGDGACWGKNGMQTRRGDRDASDFIPIRVHERWTVEAALCFMPDPEGEAWWWWIWRTLFLGP